MSSTIINIFGGSLQALETQLCYHKPSLFIQQISVLKRKLVRFLLCEIGLSYQKNMISPKSWLKMKKNESYDNIFLDTNDKHRENIEEVMLDQQHDMPIYLCYSRISVF